MKTLTEQKIKTETLAHHAMAAVGGFFGVYALFTRGATFGSSETSNLIYLVVAGLRGDWKDLLIRLGATVCYILGIVIATLGMRRLQKKFRYAALIADALICPVLALLPGDLDPVLALYPMFFATAMQWVSYTQAAGFASATIFSTNNLRQCVAGLAEYACSREKEQWRRFCFFGGTLLCFHLGVAWGWFAMQWWNAAGIYACLPLIALGAVATLLDREE